MSVAKDLERQHGPGIVDASPPTQEPPDWPWQQSQTAVLTAVTDAQQHYLAIRAANAPPEGSPSMSLGTRTLAAFIFAADCARGFWPSSRTFEIIGSDARLNLAGTDSCQIPPGLPATFLRVPTRILAITLAHPPARDSNFSE